MINEKVVIRHDDDGNKTGRTVKKTAAGMSIPKPHTHTELYCRKLRMAHR